jgi:hydroxymethylbilane synthase
MTWRIATRRSGLAQAQARTVADALTTLTDRPCELVPMATTGDEHPERAIEAFDSKGLFIDRTRQSVLDGDCDFVVHSYKDLPTEPMPGLTIPCVPRRVDPRDVLITRDGHRLATLPRSEPVTIGTSSARRRSQIAKVRRDVLLQPLRGNIVTRMGKVRDGHLDGVVLALAGLLRLAPDMDGLGAVPLEHGEVLHAPAQGVLGIECREDDGPTIEALAKLDHRETKLCVTAERWLLIGLGGGCTSPIGAHAHVVPGPDGQDRLELLGMLSDPTGTRLERASHQAALTEPEMLGQALAETLREAVGDVLQRTPR